MKYRSFNNHHIGNSHIKINADVEDYSISYTDPNGQYYIAIICDGHSDNNCFRSSEGARFGCEAGRDILIKYFNQCLGGGNNFELLLNRNLDRLKRAIKQEWINRVFKDLSLNEITEEEYSKLKPSVRELYEAGQMREHIYGATFLAVAIVKDYFLALQIGDGNVLCISEDGNFYSPMPVDERDESGSPASICDGDLFSRSNAFRCVLNKDLPVAVTVSSDGIGDSLNDVGYKSLMGKIFGVLQSKEVEDQDDYSLNSEQSDFIASIVEFYTKAGNGVEDDCSLSAIYRTDISIPSFTLSVEEATHLYNENCDELNSMIETYEDRKKKSIAEIRVLMKTVDDLKPNTQQWSETGKKLNEHKTVLKSICDNESAKAIALYSELNKYKAMIPDDMLNNLMQPASVSSVDEKYYSITCDYVISVKPVKVVNKQQSNLTKILNPKPTSTSKEIRQSNDKLAKLTLDRENAMKEQEAAYYSHMMLVRQGAESNKLREAYDRVVRANGNYRKTDFALAKYRTENPFVPNSSNVNNQLHFNDDLQGNDPSQKKE